VDDFGSVDSHLSVFPLSVNINPFYYF